MKTMYEINQDYCSAVHQAARLEAVAGNLKIMTEQTLQGFLNHVAANWKGEEAKTFLEKGKRLKDQVNRNADLLQKTVGTIRSVAKSTREAEIDARNNALSSGEGSP